MATIIENMTDVEIAEELAKRKDPNTQLLRLYRRRDEILSAGEEWANGDKKQRSSDLQTVQREIALFEASLLPCVEFCEVEIS